MYYPNISVITINYNNAEGLKLTLESVLNQTYEDFEYIVIDGNSKDESITILEEYKLKFFHKEISFRYISECDQGIYDAMNKGVDLAIGKWINFMNSGDYYYSPNVLADIFSNNNYYTSDIIYGKWKKISDGLLKDGDVFLVDKRTDLTEEEMKVLKPYPSKGVMATAHLAMFFKSDIIKLRKYDLHYKIAADFDWYMDAYVHNRVFTFVNEYVCVFNLEGVSNKNLFSTYKESVEIRNKYGTQDAVFLEKLKIIIWFMLDKTMKFEDFIKKRV